MVASFALFAGLIVALGNSAVNAAPQANLTTRAPTLGFPYGSTKVRGVNLGGWLVLEPWITPSLFDGTGDSRIVDEYTFGQYQDYNTAHSKLVNHWNTFITQTDFQNIAAAGLNHVRLPIGYWAFDISAGEPYHQGQYDYLLRAIGWARTYGIKVIIDLHGAPGSQNGFDNSGQRKDFPQWHSSSSNVARTNAVIKRLATEFAGQTDVVTSIAPLNEPAGYYGDSVLNVVRQFWYDSYGNIRYPYGTAQEGNALVLLHDAFMGYDYWRGFMPPPNWQGVAMDSHYYSIFSDAEVRRSQDQHVAAACAKAGSIQGATLWAIIGEWSNAITDCAKYLNGRGRGARYDGSLAGSQGWVGNCGPMTGNSAGWSSSYKSFLRRFWEAQVTTWEKGQGWIFWTWKAENADEWSYQRGLSGGWIPWNPAERIYPGVCG